MKNIIRKCLLTAFVLCVLPHSASAAVKILPYSSHNNSNPLLWQSDVAVRNSSTTSDYKVDFTVQPYSGSAGVNFSKTITKSTTYNLTADIAKTLLAANFSGDSRFTLTISYPDTAKAYITATAVLKYAGKPFATLPVYDYVYSLPVMKVKQISRAINDSASGISFAIDLYNHSAAGTQVTIEAIRYGTNYSFKTFNKPISGKGHALFSSSELNNTSGYKEFTLKIRYSSPDVFITPLNLVNSGGTLTGGLFSTTEVSLLKDVTPFSTVASYLSWGSSTYWQTASPYWAYCGKSDCMYLLDNARKTMDLIFATIYHLYPTRPDRRGSIGDASTTSTVACYMHPVGTHASGRMLDMNYYTKGNTNHTQYIPPGGTRTYIWSYNGTPTAGWYSSATLLTNVFDWERNYTLFLMIKKAFPNAKVMVDKRIWDHMTAQIRSIYGSTAVSEFANFVSWDLEPSFQHHTHAHVDLGVSAVVNQYLNIATLQALIKR